MDKDPLRPGSKSSEFYLTVLVMLIFVANGTTYVNIPWDNMIWIAGLAGLNIGGRTLLKKQALTNGHATPVPKPEGGQP